MTLDTGALIALERRVPRMIALLERVALDPEATITVPAGVVAQAWRDGRRQARIARLLTAKQTQIIPLDDLQARAAGVLLARRGGADVIDATVILCARERRQPILTSDRDDLRLLDDRVPLETV